MEKLITETSWEVPGDLENTKFELMSMFSYGGPATTNIKERDNCFGDMFLQVAYRKCDMPQSLHIEELKTGEILTLRDILSPGEDIFVHRTPIKLVGYLLGQQKTEGAPGLLATNGSSNHFICRARYRDNGKWIDPLKLATLEFRGGWRIKISECNGLRHIFEGPSRVFIANRL